MELLIVIAVIVGAFMLVNYGEKQKRIQIHGYDWKKDDSKRTQDERDFINKNKQDEEIMKQFNYIQQGLKYREQKLRVYIAEHGMTEYAVNEMEMCIMSLDAFQEYANKLPASLGNELMNAAKAETYARARRQASKVSFYGLDEVTEIHKHKEAFGKLFEVVNKCREYDENKNNTSIATKSNAENEEYNLYDDDILS